MKSFVKAVAAAAVLVAPALTFAQTDSGVTRAQVKQDLQRVEAAGYNPATDDTYPADVQAAERRASGQNGATHGTEYGGASNGSSASSMRMMQNDGTRPV
ncbi:hypothetical protein BHUM_04351 [Candidatus Burkholderia humilis]|nr:hypothetical protein BHUM_04351 [Candidatus Burkholderia humilis]